jgi:hypothetical protein
LHQLEQIPLVGLKTGTSEEKKVLFQRIVRRVELIGDLAQALKPRGGIDIYKKAVPAFPKLFEGQNKYKVDMLKCRAIGLDAAIGNILIPQEQASLASMLLRLPSSEDRNDRIPIARPRIPPAKRNNAI